MRYGSLFSGAGGFDLGLDAAGMTMTCAFQCEIDKQARAVLRHHWPEVPKHEDVRELSGRTLPRIDLLVGGFPCQDVSVAGNRAGLAGKRTGLFYEFTRLVSELAPEWLLLENVPGLLSSGGGRDMGAVLWALGELGYGWAYRSLDAQYFGVPQRRERLFIVGRAGGRSPAEILFEPESVPGNPPLRREAREDVAGTIGGGSGERGWAPDTDRMTFLARTLISVGALAFGWYASDSQSMPVGEQCPPIKTTMQPAVFSDPRRHDENHRGGMREKPSLNASNNDLVHHMGVRRLTPTECERLMAWPDGHTLYGVTDDGKPVTMADGPRYRMCGNGVVSSVATWIGKRLIAIEEGLPVGLD